MRKVSDLMCRRRLQVVREATFLDMDSSRKMEDLLRGTLQQTDSKGKMQIVQPIPS